METVVRVALIYVFLLVGMRIIGKREFGQLSPFEFVNLLIIPEIVSQALTREDYSLTNAAIGVSTLLSLVLLTSVGGHVSRRFNRVIAGEPSVVVRHGRMLEDTMNRERISPEEILSELHKAGIERLSQVKWAILESDGQITIVPFEPRGVARPMSEHPVGGGSP